MMSFTEGCLPNQIRISVCVSVCVYVSLSVSL